MFKKIFSIIFLGFISILNSQSLKVIPTITEADIINATALVDPINEKIKVISPSNFSLTILNQVGVDVKTDLEIRAFVTLDEDRQRSQLVSAKTKNPFKIPPTGRIFTSADVEAVGSDIDFEDPVINEILKKKLQDIVSDPAAGGKVPSGVYELQAKMTVVKIGNKDTLEVVYDDVITITVTNPSIATLQVPIENGFEYPTPFPQFQWISDTRAIKISIFEKRPEHQSLEDAISASDPFLEISVKKKESGNLSFITYPQSNIPLPGITFLKGPRPLQKGKSYVVVLDGIRTAFGYEVEPLRTIRLFTISDPEVQMILNSLETNFSGTAFQSFINILSDQKLRSNGIVTLNGSKISSQDLTQILNQNKSKIKSIRFEE